LYLDVPIEGKKTWVGQIVNAQNQKVNLKEKSNNIIAIPIAEISKGKLEI
jgi:ribosome maturation factor RimP